MPRRATAAWLPAGAARRRWRRGTRTIVIVGILGARRSRGVKLRLFSTTTSNATRRRAHPRAFMLLAGQRPSTQSAHGKTQRHKLAATTRAHTTSTMATMRDPRGSSEAQHKAEATARARPRCRLGQRSSPVEKPPRSNHPVGRSPARVRMVVDRLVRSLLLFKPHRPMRADAHAKFARAPPPSSSASAPPCTLRTKWLAVCEPSAVGSICGGNRHATEEARRDWRPQSGTSTAMNYGDRTSCNESPTMGDGGIPKLGERG